MTTIEDLQNRKKVYLQYLDECRRVEDWHGVQDAASDLREIEAQLWVLEEHEKKVSDVRVKIEQEALDAIATPPWMNQALQCGEKVK